MACENRYKKLVELSHCEDFEIKQKVYYTNMPQTKTKGSHGLDGEQ